MNNSEYYAVIFTSQLNDIDLSEYNEMAKKMVDLAKTQKGFLGMESFRGEDRNGITISYWRARADIAVWKANREHLLAQEYGRSKWYKSFRTKICKVEHEYEMNDV